VDLKYQLKSDDGLGGAFFVLMLGEAQPLDGHRLVVWDPESLFAAQEYRNE
jgi:hypothetical protein